MVRLRTTAVGRLGTTLLAIGTLAVCLPPRAPAEPTVEQAIYWWQDEIREASFAVSRAQTGRAAQWPQMSVPAGAATLPLGRATGPIEADGRLEEEAWQHATRFPVGPVFDQWLAGPFMLEVSACRDDASVYLAIRSPRDLTGLGGLTPDGSLFTVAKQTYQVGPGGGLPQQAVGQAGDGQVIELALPIKDLALPKTGEVAMTFAVEAVRRVEGKLPPELAALGLDRLATPGTSRDFRKPTLWLAPISVRLIPAEATACLSPTVVGPTEMRLAWQVTEPGKEPVAGQMPLTAEPNSAVYPYSWETTSEGKTFSAQGFLYRESVSAILSGARKITERCAALGSAKLSEAPSEGAITALESEAKAVSPQDRKAWRDLYCRARELRAQAHLSMLDAPLLFVKQHPYFAGHIYDDYYTWHPGGGIYVLHQPHRQGADRDVRAIIDPSTNETLGEGVYRDPELSWDAGRLVFAHKPGAEAMTSIYEIGMDGRGLRRLTASDKPDDKVRSDPIPHSPFPGGSNEVT